MPLDHGGRLHQHHYLEATRPQPVEQDPEQPIDGDESPTARMLAMQDCHLVTQRDDLEFQFHAASKPTSEPGEECRDVCEHAGDITAVILKTPDIPTLSDFSVATGVGGILIGCMCGIVPAVRVVLGEPSQSIRMAWDVPYGSLFLELDPLSGFFLIPVFVLCALAAIYGAEYLEAYRGKKALAPPWFFFNLLVASMVVVILARNGVLFLMAWEMMALSSFFLVTFEDEKESTRQAGWTYLVASHIGTAFLLVLFVLLGRANGSLDFDRFSASSGAPLMFVPALVGFGTKAGFIPLHVWLPEAHPAAPSHVSAVMSAVMIKTGIYGLLRILTFLGPPQAWWGWVLCVVGLTSGILGVLLALAQHDLKRLLAYHSVENIGIIALGLGVGILGVSRRSTMLTVLGFGGGLLHVQNHALFKGLLFLGAGSVLHGAGTREIDHLGGLTKRMP